MRLNGIALQHIRMETNLQIDEIVDQFAEKRRRRVDLK